MKRYAVTAFPSVAHFVEEPHMMLSGMSIRLLFSFQRASVSIAPCRILRLCNRQSKLSNPLAPCMSALHDASAHKHAVHTPYPRISNTLNNTSCITPFATYGTSPQKDSRMKSFQSMPRSPGPPSTLKVRRYAATAALPTCNSQLSHSNPVWMREWVLKWVDCTR